MCLLITWIYFGLQPGIQQGTKLKCHRPERKFKKNNKKNQGLLWQISVWKREGIGQQFAQGGLAWHTGCFLLLLLSLEEKHFGSACRTATMDISSHAALCTQGYNLSINNPLQINEGILSGYFKDLLH